eukprot:CAMPEP_0173222672 /NCGR_PEP_ID=MMETSP1142-20121109/3382_1 /TAXON_ID=483371 /ORGANISM="non described non described, Strain CCMP2298" /LENGTH=587 /DNA_ID=CAMNT_0014150791 /DNA_START=206 /DNA_END=1969 /DNA_ORIENTATION=+
MNTAYNCIDRHILEGRGNNLALIHDSPVTNSVRKLTFSELKEEVVKLASVFRELGVEKGDRVIVYMPNLPEAAITMLACARIGAIHSVVFGGFADAELAMRITDCQAKIVVAASCGIERGQVLDYKKLLDSALRIVGEKTPELVQHCLILQRPENVVALGERDIDLRGAMDSPSLQIRPECAELQSTDPLYVLYTSGTTGKPKGILRDNGGHAVALRWSMQYVYDMKPGDVFWAASDVGWVVGHSYSVYGPLLMGCTSVLYEGKPVGTPDASNFWRVIERHGVNCLFTAPTALRSIKQVDEEGELVGGFDISSLRTVFLAGERADPDSIKWAAASLGVPIRDHWWQTETGWPICSNLVGHEGYKPIKYGSTYTPCPGYQVEVLDDAHEQVPSGKMGNLAIKLPLPPGALLTLYNNPEGFEKAYMEAIPGYYDTGDAGYIDEEGYVFVMSRTDDVLNVAGHRLSSGAMEEVISDLHDVAEVAVVGIRDKLRGQVPLGLIVLNAHFEGSEGEVVEQAVRAVRERIGPVAAFKHAVVVPRLPKTRSGKILRGVMRSVANGDVYKIPATIEDLGVLESVAAVILLQRDKAH